MFRGRWIAWALLGAGLLAWPAARVVDWQLGTDVTLMMRMRGEEAREAWRLSGWRPEQGVAALYGDVDPQGTVRVFLPDDARVVVPDEAPSLRLLLLEPYGPPPPRTRDLRFRAAWVGLALALLGLLLLVRERRLRPGSG